MRKLLDPDDQAPLPADPDRRVAPAAARAAAAPVPRAEDAGANRRRFFEFLIPLQQRHFAKGVCRALLRRYRDEQLRSPPVRGRELYLRVAGAHLCIDGEQAQALLDQAEESFARWPSERELSFRDVVHMLVIVDFRARFGSRPWIRANLARVVAGEIPHDL